MNKINFTNLPSETTPVNANNLNTMQDNIEAEMGTKSVKREFQITFDADLENAKCNIELGALATYNGHFKIELVGNYLNGNYIGLIERHFDLLVVDNAINIAEGQYTYASEKASQAFAVPRIYVGSDGVVKIQVCSLTTVKKRCTLLVTMYADNISYLDVLKNAKLSNVFTSDATTYPKANALERYTGSLDDINRTCILCGAPATGYPSGAGNGWGYISTMKYSDSEMFQMYFDKITGTIFYRFKQSSTWGDWRIASQPSITTGTEFKTGRIIDGKEEYGKRIAISALPNATTSNFTHGLTNFTLTHLEGFAKSDTTQIPIPYYNSATSFIRALAGEKTLNITTGSDMSNYSGHITLYYTKNS